MCPWHHKCSVPLALSMFSAPGTFTMFTVQLSSPAQVDSGTTSLHRLPVHLGMELELPSLLWGSFQSPHSPWEWSGLWQDRSQCPPDGNWAESSSTDCYSTNGVCDGIMHCLMSACQPHCECCTFASIFSWKEIVFCTTSAVSCWPANMC